MRWTTSRDGRRRVTVRAEHRLDEQNLTDILCYRALAYGWDELDTGRNPSLAWLEGEVRSELADHGMGQWPYWRDELPDTEVAARTIDWAVRQVARLGGTMRTGDAR